MANQISDHHLHHQQQQQQQLQQQQQQQHNQHQRDSPIFHRNDRGGRGRGFPRTRRDRFAEEQNQLASRNIPNRRLRVQDQQPALLEKPSLDSMGNSRGPPLLLQPPDTRVTLNDEGRPVSRPDHDDVVSIAPKSLSDALTQQVDLQAASNPPCASQDDPEGHGNSSPVCVDLKNNPLRGSDLIVESSAFSAALRTDSHGDVERTERNSTTDAVSGTPGVSGDSEEAGSEDRSQEGSLARADEPPRQLSEHLEALMNSGKTTGVNELKRQAANGTFAEQHHEDESTVSTPTKKRTLLPNGPLLPAPPQPGELHPVVIYEYDVNNPVGNFRPRIPGLATGVAVAPGGTFPIWRGAGQQIRARGPGFRGGPRAPWMDRGPRGPPIGAFIPRGNKRGGQFRGGGGFRGRGRGGNGW